MPHRKRVQARESKYDPSSLTPNDRYQPSEIARIRATVGRRHLDRLVVDLFGETGRRIVEDLDSAERQEP